MLKNYLKLFCRKIASHKIYSAINILGLAIGLACCLAISLFVYQELSYDRHYENSSRIFRIGRVMAEEGNGSINTSYLLAPLLKQDFPEFEQVARFDKFEVYLAANGREFLEEDIGFADNSFFEIFDFQWLAGNPQQALADPFSIVLTKTLADKYFGNVDPLGEVLLLNGEYPLRVTGLVADLPANTHIRVDAWSSMNLFENLYRGEGMDINAWNFSSVFTYVLLGEDAEIGSLAERFTEFVGRHVPSGQSGIVGLSATNVADIHMRDSAARSSMSSLAKVLIVSTIAFCILLIAVINFLNLATARSLSRAQEVGIRKSNGASREQLVVQFLLESFAMTVAAMLIAVGLVEIFLPLLNRILGQELTLLYMTQPAFIAGMIVFTIFLSLVAGYYPAMHLSAFRVASAFRRGQGHGRRGIVVRNCLVVLQFTISIALIVSAFVVFQQLKLTSNLNLGYNQEQLVVFTLPLPEDMDVNTAWGSFKNQLLSGPGISAVTHSVYSPVQGGRVDIGLSNEDRSVEKAFDVFWVEYDFFSTYQIDLLAGRFFSAEALSDLSRVEAGTVRGSVILSEQAALDFGWTPEEAVGQRLGHGNGGWNTVIGVVANTVGSARQGIASNIYTMPEQYNYSFMRGVVAVRLSAAGPEQRTLDHIDATWKEFVADEPISRRFLDDQIEALYRQEQMQMGMASLSALLAVLIACFGLYGLAAFNAEHRTKEIGVRKVMGGSVWSIVLLLTNDFSKLVLISNLIAWPIAYFAMNRWLENFAYRIDLTPLIFIGSGLIALCIAWVTVGGTAAKAASQKPVLALRYE